MKSARVQIHLLCDLDLDLSVLQYSHVSAEEACCLDLLRERTGCPVERSVVCKQRTEATLFPRALSQGQSTESPTWDSAQRQFAYGWPRLGQGCILVRAHSTQCCFFQTPPFKRCQIHFEVGRWSSPNPVPFLCIDHRQNAQEVFCPDCLSP